MPADKRLPSSLPARAFGWVWKALLAFLIVSLGWVLLYKFVPPPVTVTMLSDASGPRISKDWTPLSAVDPDMARAVVAAEDAKFCSHSGFDQDAIEDAWSRYRKGGRIRGGSTISQQTAKNAFLWQGGGFFRKGLEAWFTLLIEQMWGKRRIMEVYLNVAETGIATYGVEAGALRYFKHGADRMNPAEAARIAAVLPLPKKRGAVAPSGFTRRYGNSILARMGVVRSEGLDDCLRMTSGPGGAGQPVERPRRARSRSPEAALEALVPPPDPLPRVDTGSDDTALKVDVVEEEVPAEAEIADELPAESIEPEEAEPAKTSPPTDDPTQG